MKFKKGKIYHFKWHDASGATGWKTDAEVMSLKPYIIDTVGIFVGETKSEYIFAGDWSASGQHWNSVSRCPKKMVLSAREIK